MKTILDPCCGSRMFWFDSKCPNAIFGDKRRETIALTDHSHGVNRPRILNIDPDAILDFRYLPFVDGAFRLVVFDPPHLVRAGPRSWLAFKYGKLSIDWREDLRKGFAECFRVLEAQGVLVFKWSEVQIALSQVLALTDEKPLFGNKRPKQAGSHWLVFLKPGAAND
ncbi:MAG: SAM-dependent methyltransferase [Azoarcus sp.]|jgi:hypothetical protein|nr:SAM-dependent methyltransferase [Azoarcus sp.]